jgi:hypothetical protein
VADPDADQFDAASWQQVGINVPAHLGSPGGAENRDGGARSDRTARLVCDTVELRAQDRVLDQATGQYWSVQWVAQRSWLLAHTVAELSRAEGTARG